jgi:hypothetical protein
MLMLLIYVLGGSVHTITENAEALIVTCMDTGLEVYDKRLSTLSCLEIGMQVEVTT